ncbi:Piso0_004350 [Millerozyma farinosa CBS 7064]|uniref:Piso0_004350 protein n=1 Tax=Pichia sorbitophila (strain ATCC MYA-4447 / BCRC 22081 / CBS 7064 / NBRC 10061 / NRRL Y-12695) TaxID=559304 RepID=G8Y8J9_PICSO|nr:Piso0_004350 [Millerozyma farinosa CBS 7064]CCE84794.1 Piso0_004350 [Millerozyma farinosa CBS 7064]
MWRGLYKSVEEKAGSQPKIGRNLTFSRPRATETNSAANWIKLRTMVSTTVRAVEADHLKCYKGPF